MLHARDVTQDYALQEKKARTLPRIFIPRVVQNYNSCTQPGAAKPKPFPEKFGLGWSHFARRYSGNRV
jgi:hypothetical protein